MSSLPIMSEYDWRPICKWTVVDEAAKKQLLAASGDPGGLFPVSKDDLPERLKKMPGVATYYASAYGQEQQISPNLDLLGEFVVGRIDGGTLKHYRFVYALRVNGELLFSGLPKNFPLHHHTDGAPLSSIEELFAQAQFTQNKKKRG